MRGQLRFVQKNHLKQAVESNESVEQVLLLAERLRMSTKGELDDESLVAISEATGIPEDIVRMTVYRKKERSERVGFIRQLRSAALSLDPDARNYSVSGLLAVNLAVMSVLGTLRGDQYGLIGVFVMIMFLAAGWNFSIAKTPRTAIFSGALLGGSFFIVRSLLSMLVQTPDHIPSAVILLFVLAGAGSGVILQRIFSAIRSKMGMKDPLEERQDLLRQLVELQDRLRSGEQSMSFMSLDIVGSTKMKENADSLAVEFTFTEYHKWVDWVAKRFNGQVHSTAGDGIICAFQDPRKAFAAGKYIQMGLVELNTFRNKIGTPIQLRVGIHHGTVNAPAGQDVTKINFAHVIDIAAHIQKVAPVGGIGVSEALAIHLPGGPDSVSSERVDVSGVPTYLWSPRSVIDVQNAIQPPALPAGAAALPSAAEEVSQKSEN